MLPLLTLPASLAGLLASLRACFTAPSFATFCGLAAGLCGQVRRRTVCGMLLGVGLSGAWPHDRAHYFFARARWELDELGLSVARLVVSLLVPPGAAVTVAVDDSLFRRSGRKVYGAAWQHDGSCPARTKVSFGTCFVTAGIVVRLPFCSRPVCLPVLARLHVPGKGTARKVRKRDAAPASTVSCAAELITVLAGAFPGRAVHVAADAHYHGPALKELPRTVTWTTWLPKNAVLYDLAPPRARKPGRPPRKGPRLGTPAALAATASWAPAPVHVYGRDQHTCLAEITCLWYGCLDTTTVRVILARDHASTLALVTTDLRAPAAAIIERYAARWGIEMVFPQLAKRAVRPVGGGRQDIADLDVAVGDDYAVDEQFGQQPALGEGGGGQPGPDGLAECLDPVGDGAECQFLLGRCVQLALLGEQRDAAAVQVLAFAVQLRQGDDLGEVGVQQPLLLALELAQGVADGGLPGLQLLGQPGAALRPGQRGGDLGGVGQQRAQVGPDQLVELPGGDVAGGVALPVGRPQRVGAAAAQVVAVAGRGLAAGASQPAGAAADQRPQQVLVPGVAGRALLVGIQLGLHLGEGLLRDDRRDRDGDPVLRRPGGMADARPGWKHRRLAAAGRCHPGAVGQRPAGIRRVAQDAAHAGHVPARPAHRGGHPQIGQPRREPVDGRLRFQVPAEQLGNQRRLAGVHPHRIGPAGPLGI